MRRLGPRACILSLPFVLAGTLPLHAQTITTIAGSGPSTLLNWYSGDGGPATLAQFSTPDDLVFDSKGNLYIADANNCVIRKVAAGTGTITTYAGSTTLIGGTLWGACGFSGDGGPADQAMLNYPAGLAVDSNDNLYIGDYYNNVVRMIDSLTGDISTVAGTVSISGGVTNGIAGYSGDGGPALSAELYGPYGLAFDTAGDLFIADSSNNVVREIVKGTNTITTVAGTGASGFTGDGGPAILATFELPQRLSFDPAGNLFIADPGNYAVREMMVGTHALRTVAGTGHSGFSGDGGPATLADNSGPDGIATGCDGNLFLTDDLNNRIRMVDMTTGIITTVVGNGSPGYTANGPALTSSVGHPEALTFYHGELYGVDYTGGVAQVFTGLCPITPTPTHTATKTPSPTPTDSPTPTSTPTPSATNTSTPSPTWTTTTTPTASPTDSPTRTPTFTSTGTPTSTGTSTPTGTPTPTATRTGTSTPTGTATATPGAYLVKIGVYNEAGEWIEDLTSFRAPEPIDRLDLLGGPIRRLAGDGSWIDLYSQGTYLASWKGLNAQGDPLTNGVYHIKLENVDPMGSVTTVTREARISRSLARVLVQVFNEAGESVRHLLAYTDDATGAQMTGFTLSASVVDPHGTDGSNSAVTLIVSSSTSPVTLIWDGTNDAGVGVSAGHYEVQAHWSDGTGGSSDITQGILVAPHGDRTGDWVWAQPNRLPSVGGDNHAVFSSSHPDWTLTLRVYDLAGELVAQRQGLAGTQDTAWDCSAVASGLYLVHVEGRNAQGVLEGTKTLKLLVIH